MAVVVLALAAGATAVLAHATVPGKNGQIVFRQALGHPARLANVNAVAAPSEHARVATAPAKNGRIAFTRYADSGAIFTIEPDGRGERRVTRPPRRSVDSQPDWSPDGSRIVFQREYPNKAWEVFTVKPDGSGLRQLDPGCPPGIPPTQICEASGPAWSPDGRRIAFFSAYGRVRTIRGVQWIDVGAIAVMDADGSNRRQLTQLRRPTSSEDGEPVWSPDGRRIAFVRQNGIGKLESDNRRAVFVINADGSGLRRLTPWSLDAGDHPDWSPDGRLIVFRAPASRFEGSQIYVIRPDGTGLRQLTRFEPGTSVLSYSFSPDGKWITFSKSGRGGKPDIFVMRANGTGIRPVTRSLTRDSAPDWGPAG